MQFCQDDLPILVKDALSATYPFFLGYNFFEPGDSGTLGETRLEQSPMRIMWLSRFSVRYDKGGSEKKFGMFGYGSLAYLDRSRHAMLGIFSGRTEGIDGQVPMFRWCKCKICKMVSFRRTPINEALGFMALHAKIRGDCPLLDMNYSGMVRSRGQSQINRPLACKRDNMRRLPSRVAVA